MELAANKHAVSESSLACQAWWRMSVNSSTQKVDVEDLRFETSLDYTLTVILSQQIKHSLSHPLARALTLSHMNLLCHRSYF